MEVCHACGGRGKEGGCPRCGKTPKEFVLDRLEVAVIDDSIIPESYRGRLWTKPDPTDNQVFNDFDSHIDEFLNRFLSGEIPNFSVFISSPPKYGKVLLAYSCMQTMLTRKHTVCPLFSTSDWRRLYKVSQMNPMYKLYGKYTWDSLVLYDTVFVRIDHSDDHFDCVPLMKDLLDTRSSFGLPTFFISDYSLQSLTPRWNKDSVSFIYNNRPDRDYLRYPVILQRF